MKKRYFLLIILLLVITPVVSASFQCSDGSNFTESRKEIGIWERRSVNGLGVGVINAREIPAIKKVSAELLVDTKKVTLNNNTSPENTELLSGTYSVRLINITTDGAIIEVEGNRVNIVKGDWVNISNVYAMLIDTQIPSPSERIASVLIGTNKIDFSNTENPSQLININSQVFVLELVSASSSNALVDVKKCSTGDIVEILDEPEVNITGNSTINNSIPTNNTIEPKENITEKTIPKNKAWGDTFLGKIIPYKIFLAVSIIGNAFIIIAFVYYLTSKSRSKKKKEAEDLKAKQEDENSEEIVEDGEEN